jgi:predicted phosphodiesterase
MKRILVIPDVHLTESVPKVYQLVKKYIPLFNPTDVVILGDFMDVSSLSFWDKDKRRKIEGRRYMKEVATANAELDYIQKHCKNVVFLEGNHENRVEKYIDSNPELEGVMDIPIVLKLKQRGIKYIPVNHLYRMGHLYFTHGYYYNKHYAHKTLDAYGCNLIVGHVHRPDFSYTTARMTTPKSCWGLGSLCDVDPDYMNGVPTQWGQQFAVVYMNEDTKLFNVYPIQIINNSFIFEGKQYGLSRKVKNSKSSSKTK